MAHLYYTNINEAKEQVKQLNRDAGYARFTVIPGTEDSNWQILDTKNGNTYGPDDTKDFGAITRSLGFHRDLKRDEIKRSERNSKKKLKHSDLEHFGDSKAGAEKKANELNQLAGYSRFSVIATPIPGQSATLRDSWSIKDSKTGKTYAYGSIAGSVGLSQLANELKKSKVDAVSSVSPKYAKRSHQLRHDDFQDPESEEDIEHYGVLGMKWGVRKDPQRAYDRANKKLSALDRKASKAERKAIRKETRSVRRQQRADTAIFFPKTKARLASWAIARSEKSRQKYVKKMSKAVTWSKNMQEIFKDTKVTAMNQEYVDLGKKYSDMQIKDLMANAQTSLANKQLRLIYKQMYK